MMDHEEVYVPAIISEPSTSTSKVIAFNI
jgi:hypothetical protein